MDIPTPKGIVTFDIHKFGEQDWEYESNRIKGTCSVESKHIRKRFNISRCSYTEEPFSSLTEQLRSLGYSVKDKPLERIRTSYDDTSIYEFIKKNFYIIIRVHYGIEPKFSPCFLANRFR